MSEFLHNQLEAVIRVSVGIVLFAYYLLTRKKIFEIRYFFLIIAGVNVLFIQFFSPSRHINIYYILSTINLLLLIPVIHVRRSKLISDIISQAQVLHLILIFSFCFLYYGVISGIAFQVDEFGIPFFLHSIAIAFIGMVVCLRDSTDASYNKIIIFYYLMLTTDFLLTLLVGMAGIDDLVFVLNCVAYNFLIRGIRDDLNESFSTKKQTRFYQKT